MKGIITGSTPDGHEAMEEEKVRTTLLIPSQRSQASSIVLLSLFGFTRLALRIC